MNYFFKTQKIEKKNIILNLSWCRYDCEKTLTESLFECHGDQNCISTSNRTFDLCLNECPCYKEGKCVSGCPCPSIQPESRYCSSNIDSYSSQYWQALSMQYWVSEYIKKIMEKWEDPQRCRTNHHHQLSIQWRNESCSRK